MEKRFTRKWPTINELLEVGRVSWPGRVHSMRDEGCSSWRFDAVERTSIDPPLRPPVAVLSWPQLRSWSCTDSLRSSWQRSLGPLLSRGCWTWDIRGTVHRGEDRGHLFVRDAEMSRKNVEEEDEVHRENHSDTDNVDLLKVGCAAPFKNCVNSARCCWRSSMV